MKSLSNFLHSLIAQRSPVRTSRRRFKPLLGTLEERMAPAIVIVDAPAFFVTTDAADNVVISADAATGKIQVNGANQLTDADDVTSLTITSMGDFTNAINLFGVTRNVFDSLTLVNVNTGAGNDNIVGTQVGPNIGAGLGAPLFITQTLNGGDGNDVIIGGNGDETIFAGDGNDTVFAQGGNDTIIGGRGTDNMFGVDGDDVFVWNNGDGSDTFDGGTGRNTTRVNAGGDDQFVFGNSGSTQTFQRTNLIPFTLTLTNNQGLDVNGRGSTLNISGLDQNAGITDLDFDGGGGNSMLIGPNVNTNYDVFGTGTGTFRTPGTLVVVGTFDGVANLTAGNRNDTVRFLGGRFRGRVDGGGGTNTISYRGTDFDVLVNLNTGRASSTGGIDGFQHIIGGNGDDILVGNGDFNRISGAGGDDYLLGLGGNDLLYGGAGNDRLRGGDGVDQLFGNEGADILNGEGGNDRLFGGLGADIMLDVSGFNIFFSSPQGEDLLRGRGRIYVPRTIGVNIV